MKKNENIIESACSFVTQKDYEVEKGVLEKIKNEGICVRVYDSEDKERENEIVIYTKDHKTLSDNMPILENLGLCIESEVASSGVIEKTTVNVRKYIISCLDFENWKRSKENLAEVVEGTIQGTISNSPLNSLAYLANLNPREIRLIKAIAAYEDQLITVLSEQFIAGTLVKYSKMVPHFRNYFDIKFKPDMKNRDTKLKKEETAITDMIHEVANISEDRVLRIFYQILCALTRTNYYFNYEQIAFKVDVTKLSAELKGLQPRIEAFVYHPKFSGLHLRRSLISRGGIRYSDRYDDYRNEVKDLMKAQRSKNSVIIPSGAKGGFIIRNEKPTREEFKEVYETYMNSLLDLVDNRDEDKIIRDERIVAYDRDDSYFVVAADKGTAAMSDVANAISESRGFWLGDAFASGGSKGYNHKEMGITAKGSIKSTERFFIEQGLNFYEKPISVVGIGSPSGDVFGNGIQLSEKFSLIAAIGSREIFIDPNPDLEKSYAERRRLFESQQGWSHYNTKLISEGGGVFQKSDKAIKLTPQIKQLFGIKKDVVDGPELTRTILCAKVDMLFNGGVGTYVKATAESNSEIGDKPNESVRVDAKDIRAYSVCEGGNLGFTQKARIEYAKGGGRINMDAIDNSAGVNTSDIEVNLKIILNSLVHKNVIKEEHRIELLHSMIPNVEKTVLWTNYFQALAISLDEIRSREDMKKFKRTVNVLEERVDNFVRGNFEIPSSEDFNSVVTKTGAVARPILSIMLSYAKIYVESFLKQQPEFLDSNFAQHYVFQYFPKTFSTIYKSEVADHPLRREIIANYIANKIINAQGATFIHDASELGDERFMTKIKAFLMVNSLYSANDVRFELFRQDYKVPSKRQYELLLDLDYMINFSMEWFIEHGEYKIALKDRGSEYRAALSKFIDGIDEKYIKKIVDDNELLNRFFSLQDYIQLVLTIIDVKESTHQDFAHVASLFFTATTDLGIFYITDTIREIHAENDWEERLKNELEKDAFETIFHIIETIMNFKRDNETIEEAYNVFAKLNEEHYTTYLRDLKNLKGTTGEKFTALTVVINSLKKIMHVKS